MTLKFGWNFSLLLGLLAAPGFALAQGSTPATAALGTWLNAEKDGRIQIYQCGNRLCGRLVQITTPDGSDPRLLRDTKNPDPKLRQQPLLNLVLMQGFRFAGPGVWDGGTIYDARSGKTYAGNMRLVSPNRLDVRGFIGFAFAGRTTSWTRVF